MGKPGKIRSVTSSRGVEQQLSLQIFPDAVGGGARERYGVAPVGLGHEHEAVAARRRAVARHRRRHHERHLAVVPAAVARVRWIGAEFFRWLFGRRMIFALAVDHRESLP